ncbi:uncharacterized protein LOC128986764 [Macrosteles quadrilineatus]|uniref:uncharacterized protein LOC128986764 n=1 Tax=Macrosteles quadrilineatus TaxID=74068 RepID=UPI0023E219F2|nr:uncharacterized protein LOC128986764 [Macrosteles quadrilineatus]
MALLTTKQKIEILVIVGYGDKKRTQLEACDIFNNLYPDRQINRATVSKICNKFAETGDVASKPRSGRPKSVLTEETRLNILLSVEENHHTSTRRIGNDFGISHMSVHKALKAEKFHPFKVQLIHELNEDDFDRRIEFCELMMQRCTLDPMFKNRIVFSDEASFSLHGHVNRQNYRYWSPENPHWTQECHTQNPQKVNVWAGIVGTKLIGPFVIEGNLNGNRYLELLRESIVPAIAHEFPPEDEENVVNENIWFQQDGAPPHYNAEVRNYLDEVFPDRWIGRRGAIEWPARSPDLTPLDYFLWGHLKSRVFVNRPENIQDLTARIIMEARSINEETLSRVVNEFYNRLGLCQVSLGHQFEHL